MAFSPRSNKERKSRFSIDPDLAAISRASPTRALSQRQRSRAPPIPAREVRKAQKAASLPRGSLLSGNPLIQAGLTNRVVTELLALDRARVTQAKARERAAESAERFAPTFTEAQLDKKARMEARAAWEKRIQDLEQKLIDSWDDYLSHHYETTGEELKDKDPDFLKMAQNEVGPFFFNPRTKKPSFKPTSPLSAREIFSKGVIYKGKGRRRGKKSKAKYEYDSDSDEEMRGGGYKDILKDLKDLFNGEVFFSQLRDETKYAIAEIPVFPDVPNWEFRNKPLRYVHHKYGRTQAEKDLSVFNFLEENPIVEEKIMSVVRKMKPQMSADADEFVPQSSGFFPDYTYNDRADTQFMGLPPTMMSVVNMAEPNYSQEDDREGSRTADSFFSGRGRCMPRFHSREYHGRGRLGFDNPLPGSTRGW